MSKYSSDPIEAFLWPMAREFLDPTRHLNGQESINISMEARQAFQTYLQMAGKFPPSEE